MKNRILLSLALLIVLITLVSFTKSKSNPDIIDKVRSKDLKSMLPPNHINYRYLGNGWCYFQMNKGGNTYMYHKAWSDFESLTKID